MLLVGGSIGIFLCFIAVAAAGGGISSEEIAPFIVSLMLLASIAHLTFIHRFWKSIQDGHPRMSPGKAIGLLFVPIFNIFWLFQVYGGFATDYNNHVKQKAISAPNLSRPLLAFNAVLILVPVPILNWIVWTMTISRICAGVNAIRVK